MFFVAFVVVLLAGWFGFELGRKWEEGRAEEELEALAETHSNGRIRLNSITIRR
jgi:hypothetical protein